MEDVCSSSPARTPKLQLMLNNHPQENAAAAAKSLSQVRLCVTP